MKYERVGLIVVAVTAEAFGCFVTAEPVGVAYTPATPGSVVVVQPSAPQPAPPLVITPSTRLDGGAMCMAGPTQAATVHALDWLNCTYQAHEGLVTVRDGHYERPMIEPHEYEWVYSFDVGDVSYGDVTGDGAEDALVPTEEAVTWTNHACDNDRLATLWSVRDGGLVALATITQTGVEGDCIGRAAIQDGAVVVQRDVWHDTDPDCCPSERRWERWMWNGTELREDIASRQSEECLPTGNCDWSSGEEPPPDSQPPAPQLCSPDGWCWSSPLPQSSFPSDVWGTSANDIWVVGSSGPILRWDGSAWSTVPSPDDRAFLDAVWGSGPNDVWAVGAGPLPDTNLWGPVEGPMAATDSSGVAYGMFWDGPWASTILRWNGSAWSKVRTGTGSLHDVWGSGPNDVWVVGGNNDTGEGTILRWDGSAWTESSSPEGRLWGVWGSSPDDVWAVGELGKILHWNGSAWSNVPSGTGGDLKAVWGSGPNDVWAVGPASTILRWNGSVWSGMEIPTTPLVPASPEQPGVAGWLNGVWGSASNDVWATGTSGAILRWNGSLWSSMSSGTTNGLGGVWGSGPNDVWTVGAGGTILHRGP